jgi:hypothetical protein
MLDSRVVGRSCGGHRFFKLSFVLVGRTWLNWKPGEALRWKVETVGWEGRGVVYEKSARPRF